MAARDQGAGVAEFLAAAPQLVYGTTIATNVVLNGGAARTAFLTTQGHPDILVLREAGRMGLPTVDYSIAYPKPYVPGALIFEVQERIGADGEIVTPLDEAALLEVFEHAASGRESREAHAS